LNLLIDRKFTGSIDMAIVPAGFDKRAMSRAEPASVGVGLWQSPRSLRDWQPGWLTAISPLGSLGFGSTTCRMLAGIHQPNCCQSRLGDIRMTPQMQFSIWIIAFLFAILAIAILCYTLLVFKGFQHSNKDTRALDTLTSRDGGLEFVTVAIVLPAAFISLTRL
jgi:hypothetical protein